MLAKAGYPDGFKATFIQHTSRLDAWGGAVEPLAAMFKEVGVDCDIRPMQQTEFVSTHRSGDYEFSTMVLICAQPELDSNLTYMYMTGAPYNRARYSNPKVDELLQQQRVAFARSMIVEPDVLLLDEPFNALDAKIRKTLQMELKNIQKKSGMTMIFVTHDQEEALTISDRIFVINEGRVAQSGKPLEIYSQPASEFVARFIGNFNVLKGEEFERLVGEPFFSGKSLAIRPEIIKLSLNGENGKGHNGSWRIKGEVVGMYLKGNILRYRVRSKDCILDVDVLNKGLTHNLNYGAMVELAIPKDQVKELVS